MKLNIITDKIVFKFLKLIKYGSLELTNFEDNLANFTKNWYIIGNGAWCPDHELRTIIFLVN